ncbi:MAG: hypothetical protein PHZ02_06310 [Desulfocapsaceae bacterium]|nr:hypothetical protein [Desulfocapsaceae bacterium]
MTFCVGGQRCALEARQVRALQPLTDENSGTYPAIGSLLGLPEPNKACLHRQIVTIRLPESEVELSVAAPVELHELAVDLIQPLPDMVAARTQLRGLRALVMETDGVTLIFDLRNLLSEVITS